MNLKYLISLLSVSSCGYFSSDEKHTGISCFQRAIKICNTMESLDKKVLNIGGSIRYPVVPNGYKLEGGTCDPQPISYYPLNPIEEFNCGSGRGHLGVAKSVTTEIAICEFKDEGIIAKFTLNTKTSEMKAEYNGKKVDLKCFEPEIYPAD